MITAVGIQIAIMVSGILIARLLGPENRGHLAFIVLAPLILSQIGHLGLPLALTYYISRAPELQSALISRATKVLVPMVGASLIFHVVIIILFASRDGSEVMTAALLTLMATVAWIGQAFALAVLQGQQRFGAFNLLRSLQVGLYAVMSVGLLALSVRDLSIVAGAWSFTFVVSSLTCLTVALRPVSQAQKTSSDLPSTGALARFGLCSLPAQVSPIDSFRLDQIILGIAAGPAALGYYVAAHAFSNLPRVVSYSIGMVAYPKVAAASSEQTLVALRYIAATITVCGSIVVGLEALAGQVVPIFFGEEFGASVGIARILLLAAFFMSLKRILNDCARGLGRPELGLRAEIASWLPLLPGFLLMGRSGEGIAWTLVASSVVGALALGIQLSRSRRGGAGLHAPIAVAVNAV